MSDNVSAYLVKARERGRSMIEGDSIKANELHDEVQEAYEAIVAAGQQQMLFQHVDDPNDAVAFFVASHLKQADVVRALPVYHRLVGSTLPFVALSAKYILEELGP